MKKLTAFIVIIFIVAQFTGCNNQVKVSSELDKAISTAILSDNKNGYASGECTGEGHIILGCESKDSDIMVYALTMYAEFGFENNGFVKVSGSGIIPAALTFSLSNGIYTLKNIKYPQDGSDYEKSINEIFPLKYRIRAMNPSDNDAKSLTSQERKYAEDYLKAVNRTAKIGDYSDFEHVLLTDKGVSDQVSNMIAENKDLYEYPSWIGNREVIENGTRIVYEVNYNENLHEINFIKYNYNTKEVIMMIMLDSDTGLPKE